MEDRVFYGNHITAIKKTEDCTVYQLKDCSGEGVITCYNVFPGIDLLYNDLHMQSCYSEFRPKAGMIGIDHCRQGRIEWEFRNGTCMYLEEGDLQIDLKEHHTNRYGFPLDHYHGITIAIYMEEALHTLPGALDGFSINLWELREKFCGEGGPFIMRARDSIKHIFSELYTIPDKIRKPYQQIKVLELLLFLSGLDVRTSSEARMYFPRHQVETVKAIQKYMTDHIEKHFTLEELSSRFGIPLTAMKVCFKGIYGTPVYAYMRAYRIRTAAHLMRETGESVTAAAGKVGYSNPSKFAAAFREIMGLPPAKYRKDPV